MKTFPTLYKKTSTGAIQTWSVRVEGSTMYSESGKLNGAMVPSQDTIKEGKNIGRSNETTPEQQALLEAESRWTRKKKTGYVETLDDAKGGLTSDLVEGGFLPMLAKSFDKDGKHILYPCAAQPKLDGIRATHTGGNHLWTRTRKEIKGVPHIAKTLEPILQELKMSCLVDGELYNHDLKDNFEEIVHIVKQTKKPAENHKIVEYHIYDLPSPLVFSERIKMMQRLKDSLKPSSPIRIVETVICNDYDELMKYNQECLELGYEGVMVRNLDSIYDFKRSKNLQKIKVFEDAEFEIVGVEEGRGKLTGHAGSFICKNAKGIHFNAKLKGKLSDLRKYYTEQENYAGRMLTVQFQGYTNKNEVPRFPVGLRVREPNL